MSAAKIALLIVYAALALAVILAGGQLANYCAYILGGLALIHLAEMAVFFRRCQQAGGSLPLHLLNVFLFGIVHMKELDAVA